MTEGVRVFPERLNPESEEFQSAIEALSRPPERELSEEDRFEVKSFEHALANGEVPFGLPLPDQVRRPEHTLREVFDMTVKEDKYCLEYFAQDKICAELFPELVDVPQEERESILRAEMAKRLTEPEFKRGMLKPISRSKLYAREKLEANLKQLYETGEYDHASDPRYDRAIANPETLIERATAARSLKGYYRDVEKQMSLVEGANTDLKQVLLAMHQQRANMVLSGCYKDALTLIRQDREGHVLDEDRREALKRALPALRLRSERETNEEAGFVDRESFARFLDRLDKYSRGIDRSGDQGHIPQALRDLREQYEFRPGIIRSDFTYSDVDPELLSSTQIDSEQLKTMLEQVLSEYGLLSESQEYDPESEDRAPDQKWRVVIDPKESRKTLAVIDKKRCMLLPQKFDRTLNQRMPAGCYRLLITKSRTLYRTKMLIAWA